MRKSFIVHIDSLAVLDELTDSQCGELLRAMKSHHDGTEFKLSPITKIVFSPFKAQFARDEEKYQKIVDRNRNNGLKGGRPKNPTEPSGLFGNPTEPRKADSDSKSVSDSGSDNKSKSDTNKPKAKPAAKKKPSLDYSCWPQMPSDQTMKDWIDLRKAKRAKVSQTVINNFGRELQIAVGNGFTVEQCLAKAVTKGWTGFEADWMTNNSVGRLGQQRGRSAQDEQEIQSWIDGKSGGLFDSGEIIEHE